MKKNTRNMIIIIAFGIITVVLWQIPEGRIILYPFTILGTWFHEMGHGIAALIMGGNFEYLELMTNGSGLAYHSGPLYLGNIGRAVVAAGGPIGPALAGALLIYSSARNKTATYVLLITGIVLLLSVVLWVQGLFGILIILAFGLLIMFIAIKGSPSFRATAAQFLGVQAVMSVYQSIDYLFSTGANIGSQTYLSDTQRIAENLFLPHWFWAGIIIIFAIMMIVSSFRYVVRG